MFPAYSGTGNLQKVPAFLYRDTNVLSHATAHRHIYLATYNINLVLDYI